MLEDVKKYLRISHEEYDDEVQDLIDACKKDLELSGIASSQIIEDDTLIKRAIVLYCKLHFGFDNPDYDKLTNAYNLLVQHLSLSTDYNTESEDSI